MRVLLVNPPSTSPQPVLPLGLAYLAAALETAGVPVRVIDAWAEGHDLEALERRIRSEGPWDLIGVTVMSPTYAMGKATVRVARRAAPAAKIIIGGTHPSSLPEASLQDCPEVDFAAVGEGDELLVSLARVLAGQAPAEAHRAGRVPAGTPAGKGPVSGLEEIPGLVFRRQGGIVRNGPGVLVRDLDRLPLPAWHLFPIRRYVPHPPYRILKSFATMITSRGCPFHCTYCTKSVSGSDFRLQSPARILREIDHLRREFGVKQIHFYDDDFTRDRGRILALAEGLLERGRPILWSCVARVDSVDPELLRRMKQAGCWLISYGVESGNQGILDRVLKGYRVDQVRRSFALTREAGILTLGYFMAGLPGETTATLNDTIRLSFELDPDFASWSVTALYPGSTLFQQAMAGRFGDRNRVLPLEVAPDAAHVSSQSPYAQGHVCLLEGEVPRPELLASVESAYRGFYFRPRYLFRFLRNLMTATQGLSYAGALWQYLRWRVRQECAGRPSAIHGTGGAEAPPPQPHP